MKKQKEKKGSIISLLYFTFYSKDCLEWITWYRKIRENGKINSDREDLEVKMNQEINDRKFMKNL